MPNGIQCAGAEGRIGWMTRRSSMQRAQKKSFARPAVPAPTVSRDDIAREAFKLFQARHGAPGDPVADWFEAERIVMARATTPAPREAAAAAAKGGNGRGGRRNRSPGRR
jgi:hypothetical protein